MSNLTDSGSEIYDNAGGIKCPPPYVLLKYGLFVSQNALFWAWMAPPAPTLALLETWTAM